MNLSEKVQKLLLPDTTLPAYAWPGGYDIVYIDSESACLCNECAVLAVECDPQVEGFVLLEGDQTDWESITYCDNCGKNFWFEEDGAEDIR